MKSTAKSNCSCVVCGKSIYRKPSVLKKTKNTTCSMSCMGEFRKVAYAGESNPNFGNKGDLNPLHKGYRTKHCGYYWIYMPSHPFSVESANNRIREHRHIAEQHHLTEDNSIVIDGVAYLSPKFDVHHINGNKLDNRPDNLEIISRADHSRHHKLEDPVDRCAVSGRYKTKEE